MSANNPPSLSTRRNILTVLYDGVGILIWLACVAVCIGALYTCSLLMPEEPLRPPGWLCDAPGPQWKTAGCIPVKGYHFEVRGKEWAAVHDVATPAIRQRDLDIAGAWHLLTNEQRKQVLDGKATIYEFVERVK